mgnify:FL=1
MKHQTHYAPLLYLLQFLLVALLLIYEGCSEDYSGLVQPSTETPNTNISMLMKSSNSNYQRINDAIEDFAIIIAKAVEEKEFREFLKAEAMKKFDGDYDILYSLVKDKTTKSGKTLHSKVTEIAADVKRAGASKFKSEFSTVEELIVKIPKLQIAIPVNCEKWNTENFIPPVACLNSELKKKAVTHVKAYDSKGNIVMLEKKNKPDYPVIVISINERLNENGKVRECYLKKNTTLNKTVYEPNIISKLLAKNGNVKRVLSDSNDPEVVIHRRQHNIID